MNLDSYEMTIHLRIVTMMAARNPTATELYRLTRIMEELGDVEVMGTSFIVDSTNACLACFGG